MDTYDFPDPVYPVNVRQRPSVPPKPPIDTLRYSMNNIKDSSDWQLDELLEELEALETQLNTPHGGDQLCLGVSAIPVLSDRTKPAEKRFYPEKQSVVSHNQGTKIGTSSSSCSSPDGDSAFCDGSSTESNHRSRNSTLFSSSTASYRDSINTPSPINPDVHRKQNESPESAASAEDQKALKIRQALEKMKEANVTKIFVKFFVEDGQPLQILIDERWTVADTMKHLAEKNQIPLMEDHCIVEEFPELYIRRIYEDHEKVVENIQLWVQDSKNKLYFIRRPDKYSFIDRPDVFMVTDKTKDHFDIPKLNQTWSRECKQQFVRDFFSRDPVVPPELQGFLYLKSDGRKSWKKHLFVLRPSGLYYSPKGKKSSKDLSCLMNFHSNQVYTGINWEKKYKSPTPFCISIKLTALQIKRSQYIKYLCADDELTFKQWLVALRIAKSGAELFKNYENACAARRETLGAIGTTSASSSSTAISSCCTDNIMLRPQSEASSFSIASYSNNNKNSINYSTPSRNETTMTTAANNCIEDPMGTIKRAPIEITRTLSVSSNSISPTVEEEDSDEEFPAPPPVAICQKVNKPVPPPPPKRSKDTRIQTTIQTPSFHKNDLEAALARRREKMSQ